MRQKNTLIFPPFFLPGAFISIHSSFGTPTCNCVKSYDAVEISLSAQRCPSCAAKQQKRIVENRPSRKELKNMIRKKSFV